MSRPESHREQIPEQRCGNCIFARWVRNGHHLLCFHGDESRTRIVSEGEPWEDVEIDGNCISIMEEEFDEVWGGRSTDSTDVCDEWKPKEEK